jgi:hypothetical protein
VDRHEVVAATRITTQDIKDSAVITAKIADGAVSLAKLGALTTKGDLLATTGSGAHTRLGVGANGTVLTANSAAANGFEWATAGSLGSANFVANEVPTGTVNGANASFVVNGGAAITAGSLELFKNGIRQLPGSGNDYTVADSTGAITFLAGNLPQTGDNLVADYRK